MTGALSALALAAALAAALPAPLSAQPSQDRTAASPLPAPEAARRDRVLALARRIMSQARYCTLVTLGEGQQPQARIMDPLPPDASLVVYLATNPRSRKVAEIRRDPRVTLLYFDPARPAYVTVIGRAAEIASSEKAAHYKDDWQAFFPREKPDSYSLYRVVPSRIELVSAPDGLSGNPTTWRPEIVEMK